MSHRKFPTYHAVSQWDIHSIRDRDEFNEAEAGGYQFALDKAIKTAKEERAVQYVYKLITEISPEVPHIDIKVIDLQENK